MCQMCRQNPCHNMCPNAEPRETLTCRRCGYEYSPEEAEDYVRFSNGDVVCKGCLHDYCVEMYGGD